MAEAIVETVTQLKKRYRLKSVETKPAKDLPSRLGKVIGTIRRVDIYGER